MACSSLIRGRFDSFISNANESVFIKLISNTNQLNSDSDSVEAFNPEFCHQLFGDNETIFGYKGLKVNLLYSSAKLNCYLGLDFTEKVTKDETNGIEADDVLKTIADKLEIQFCYSIDEFSSLLSKESQFKPYGQLIDKFSIEDNIRSEQMKREFEIYSTDISVPGFDAYHQRMQTFLYWFIDAASYIDSDDERWQFFIIYEKIYQNRNVSNGHSANSEPFLYCFVGYATIYRYYSYPERTRPRISQFLILPPFQKRGLGVRFLNSIYNFYGIDNKVIDITVEDPSDNFSRIRDFIDCQNCSKLDSFSPEKLRLGWNEEMAKESQNKLKISKKQSRRVYEILRFRITDRSDPQQYKAFRIEVKQRLNAPFMRQILDIDKIEKQKRYPEQEIAYMKQTILMPKDLRLDQLDKQYKELEDQYQHIIERLASS